MRRAKAIKTFLKLDLCYFNFILKEGVIVIVIIVVYL